MKNVGEMFLIRQVRVRPRLFTSILVGIAVSLAIQDSWLPQQVTRLLIGWNVGAILYIVLASVMMWRSDEVKMHQRACQQDDGQLLILAMVVVAAMASLAAIIVEMGLSKNFQGDVKIAHIALAVLTIVTTWAFIQVMFALHYAHDFYISLGEGLNGGLEFPGTKDPEYGDFLYFSCIIGTSAQTADVSVTTKPMRRINLLHCILAFIFNTTLLALTINLAAGLF